MLMQKCSLRDVPHDVLKSKYMKSCTKRVVRNSEPTYWHETATFCFVTNSFPGSSLADATA
jgi:hypothetical protein